MKIGQNFYQILLIFYKLLSILKIQKQQKMNQQTEENVNNTIVPQSKKLRNQKQLKQFKINIQLISQTSLDQNITQGLSQQEKIQAVLQLRSIHLEWLNIRKIENLQVFTNLNILYLQHNKIAKIQHLECLKNLQYLALNDNLISVVQGVKQLKKLSGLNLNNNQIQQINAKQLPNSIQLLSFKQNPVSLDANYRNDLVKNLPILQVLDDYTITPQERLKIIGKFPQHLIQYSQKMKQFRNKQKIKKQLEENQKILYKGGTFDQNETLRQIRQKTNKFMEEAQNTFKNQMKEQNESFQSKIKVSRKIRNFKQQRVKAKMGQIKETNQQHTQQN